MKLIQLILPPALYRKRTLRKSIKRQKKVADAWNPVIDAYFEGKIEKYTFKPKKELDGKKIIWQYWHNGTDEQSIPELIKICFDSVDKYKSDYDVIRLSDKNVAEYIDIPDFVLEKRKNNPKFKIPFFSDLVRLILLKTYGGVWLDATIFLTDTLPQQYAGLEYFLFQRSDEELHKDYWVKIGTGYYSWLPDFKVNSLNSVIFGKQSSEVLGSLLDIMLYFWKKSETFSYYFTFQVMYNEIITRKLPHLQCPIVNDCIPHILQAKILKDYPFASFEEIVQMAFIHKLSHHIGSKKSALTKLKDNLHRLNLI